jgi:transposase InsO family protein
LVKERNTKILERMKELKSEHPCWGYRRIWAYLHYRDKILLNKKRIYRVMKEEQLLVTQTRHLRANRTPMRPKPKADRPNQFWGTDMTKVMIPSFGWLYLVVVLDWYTKKIVGYSLGIQSKATDWLDALNMAVNNQFPDGVREHQQLMLVSDNGSQPTSERFMKECSVLGIKQIFASFNNPKGNADTERFMRTIKEDLVWPNDFGSVSEFQSRLKLWIENYNTDYPHSSIGYKTPCEFEALLLSKINSAYALTNSLHP